MHMIQSLKNEFCFDLPMFSKYPATSKNSYFYKMTLFQLEVCLINCLTGIPLFQNLRWNSKKHLYNRYQTNWMKWNPFITWLVPTTWPLKLCQVMDQGVYKCKLGISQNLFFLCVINSDWNWIFLNISIMVVREAFKKQVPMYFSSILSFVIF